MQGRAVVHLNFHAENQTMLGGVLERTLEENGEGTPVEREVVWARPGASELPFEVLLAVRKRAVDPDPEDEPEDEPEEEFDEDDEEYDDDDLDDDDEEGGRELDDDLIDLDDEWDEKDTDDDERHDNPHKFYE